MNDTGNNKRGLPRYAFWGVKPENLDFSRDKGFIISRMFERGFLDAVLSVIGYYGKDGSGKTLQLTNISTGKGFFSSCFAWAAFTRF